MGKAYSHAADTDRARMARERLYSIADHCANGGSLADFARINGMSKRGAMLAWQKVRDALGWQAS